MTHRIDDWRGLYSEGWQGEITPDAFSHPAKFSRALIRAIYDHAAAEGWLAAGDMVVDPFGGVGLGGIDAMRLGCHWIGCELEQKFVDLGRANIELWESRYRAHFPAWGTARLLQGDSRQLAAHLAGARLAVSSPPYSSNTVHGRSGPFDVALFDRAPGPNGQIFTCADYGSAAGQLGAMSEGDLSLAISSPPYAGSVNQSDQANDAGARIERKAAAGVDVSKPVNVGGPNSILRQPQAYGNEPGQLGAMREGNHGATLAVSSPPFAQQQTGGGLAKPDAVYIGDGHRFGANHGYQNQGTTPGNLASMTVSSPPYRGGGHHNGIFDTWGGEISEGDGGCADWAKRGIDYGRASGQMEQMGNDDTFWTAARTIVEQTYQVLKPGGHAVFVVKAFVRNKARVDFPGQWRQLCEAVGFVTLHEHRAWLVEERGTQIDLFGNHHTKTVERKSFFRRLAESKGSPRIDWETVYCMVKPD